jgi:FSR family fosmidomycin resistance protein-like MFS transporter
MRLYAKRSLYVVAFGHLVLELCNQCLPIVYPLLITAGALTYTQIGTISLVAGMTSSLTQPFLGHLSDRWDPRKVIALSVGLSGLSIGLVGLMDSWLPLVLLVGLAMIGSAAFHPSGATVAAASAHTARGAAVAVFSVGGTIGSALSPLLASLAIRWLGARGTLVMLPAGFAGAALVYSQLKRFRHARQGARRDTDGPVRPRPVAQGSLAALALIIVSATFRMALQIPFLTYLPTWVQIQGGTLEAGARMLFVFTVGTGLGSMIGGPLADRIGRWQSMAFSLGLLGPAAWALHVVPPPLQVVLTGLMGGMIGANFPVAIVAAQESWPGSPGVATGLALGVSWIGAGLGGLVTGLVADYTSVDVALRWLAVPGLLAFLCVLAYPMVERHRERPDRVPSGPAR